MSMFQSTSAKKAIQCLPKAHATPKAARRFSSTPTSAAISPHRTANLQQQQTKRDSSARRNVSATAKSNAQAAAQQAPQRAVPSPAFNRGEPSLKDVQPLQPFRQPEMDHSFIGMTGGQIFHEMMLRHEVKHVCMYSALTMSWERLAKLTYSHSRLPRRCHPTSLRCHLQQRQVRLHPPSS